VDTTPTAVTERLDALHVDAEARFEELRTAYIDEVRGFVEQAGPGGVDLPYERRVAERLMDLAPPGLDEIAGLVVVMEQAEASRYNRLVLDAAPTGHFLRFVETPATMNEWIQTLYRLLRKYRRVVQAPRLADRLVRLSKQLRRFQRVVRNEPAPDRSQAADTGERAGSDGRVGRGKREAAPSASPPRSGVCAVTIPTAVARAETKRLVARCQGAGLDVPALIINRMPAGDEDAQRVVDALRADLDGPALGLVRDGTPPQGLRALTALGHALYDRR
jgi:arsenite-transporting ATPase